MKVEAIEPITPSDNHVYEPYVMDNLLRVVYIYDDYEHQYETDCNRKLPAILVASYPRLFTVVDNYIFGDIRYEPNMDTEMFYRRKIKNMYSRIDYLNHFNKKRHKAENADELSLLRRMIRYYEGKLFNYLTNNEEKAIESINIHA